MNSKNMLIGSSILFFLIFIISIINGDYTSTFFSIIGAIASIFGVLNKSSQKTSSKLQKR